MIVLSYKPVLKIGIHHDFFGAEPCPDIALRPVTATGFAMTRLGLRAEEGAGTLTLWSKSGADSVAIKSPLAFGLIVTQPQVFAYTEPDWPGGEAGGSNGSVLCFGPEGTDGPALVAGATLRAQDATPLPRRQPQFNITPRDVAPEAVFEVSRPPDPAPVQKGTLADACGFVDLSGQPDGRYLLSIADRPGSGFALVSGVGAAPFGLLSLAPDQLAPTAPLAGISLTFKARRVHWEYVLMSRQELAGATIEGLPTAFGPAAAGTVRGKPAWTLRSDAPIPLRAANQAMPAPKLRPRNDNFADSIALPIPTPDALSRDKGTGDLVARLHVQI